MSDISEAAKLLYKKMSELTEPVCKSVCRVPMSCCDRMYCEWTVEYAKIHKEPLVPNNDNKIPLMGPSGCIAPPHLRPWCTLHVCSINSIGCDPKNPEWTKEYFELREKIETEEDLKAQV